MSGAPHPGAHWAPEPPGKIRLPVGGQTVNLSAVSATLTAGGGGAAKGARAAYSPGSSPGAHGSSTHSSPYAISRTGSGASEGSAALREAPTPHQAEHPPSSGGRAALGASAGAAGSVGSRPGSPGAPHGASTPPRVVTSKAGPGRGEVPGSIEATLQGLTISGASSPTAPPPPHAISFTAPPGGALPQPLPVEVFARFPQEPGAGPSGRGAAGNGGPRNGGPSYRPAGRTNSGGAGGPAAYAGAGGYAPGSMGGPAGPHPGPHQGPSAAAFYVGSPPGGYLNNHMGPTHMAFHAGPPGGPGGQGPPAAGGFGAAAFYAQGGMPPHPHHHPMPHPHPHQYYGMLHQAYPGPHPGPPFPLVYPGAPLPGGGPGGKGGYEAAADYQYQARQYQAMMSYMQQGFGMMVSPSGSPERVSRPSSAPSFRRNGQDRRDDVRGRPGGRPSRLSLDMSASKSENGDAHRLDPELVPLVAEDKTELQSDLLDEFRASRELGGGRSWSLEVLQEDLRGHLYPFCRDQHGSRLVQQHLEGADPQLVSELFAEVRHKLVPLMVDVFGNYVVQRFLERGGEEVAGAVAEAMRGRVLPLSLQMYGCRVVQKALEVLPQSERVSICGELTEQTLRCVRDQNGNHVVQKCIECVQPSEPARGMIEIIVDKCQSLSSHTFGCRLVQRVLEFCSIADLRQRVIDDVLGSALQLSHDQYGNYVVQHLVIKGPAEAREVVVGKVAPQVMTLAQHKYASNVVEACLKHGCQAHRDAIVDQMISDTVARPGSLTALMRDQYGNYVVQRALDVATPAQRASLLQAIQPHLDSLRKYTYGKHIVSKVGNLLAAQAAAAAAEAQAAAVAAPPVAAQAAA